MKAASRIVSTLGAVLALALLSPRAPAQLADWKRGFENPGVDGTVYSMAEFDDGHGLALYVGGNFEFAGTIATRGIARWDGTSWSAVGNSSFYFVNAMARFDDGTGPQLYAAGQFQAGPGNYTYLARWNGTVWTPLPATTGPIYGLAVFDDGTGPALFAGGSFVLSGSAYNVARLTASGWAPLGPGLGSSTNDRVNTLAVHDDGMGGGLALYAGGAFTTSGGASIIALARWDGSSWSAVGAALNSSCHVYALTEFADNHGGPTLLYAGGSLLDPNGSPLGAAIAWDGVAWSQPGGGVAGGSSALKVFDDGSGPALYAGGAFYPTGGGTPSRIARWDGTAWSLSSWRVSGANDHLDALGSFQRGGVPTLYAGGWFTAGSAGSVESIAQLDNGQWVGLGGGAGLDYGVTAILADSHLNGQAHQLIAAGYFHNAGTVQAEGIARWDGTNWHPLGSGIATHYSLQYPHALAEYDDGTGLKLYATGDFYLAGGLLALNIAAWDGSNWSTLGRGLDFYGGNALAVWDGGGGSELYVGGYFSHAGSVAASNLARWNGTRWATVGGGVNGAVGAVLVHDFGSGTHLYVAGGFTLAGTTSVLNAAMWDGVSWHALGNLSINFAKCLAAYDDGMGGGEALYAGGSSFTVGGANVMRWDGTSWSAVGGGVGQLGEDVDGLVVHDDSTGGGPGLYACGVFHGAGTTCAHNIARWNGHWWEEVAGNLDGPTLAMSEGPSISGGPGSLFAGGFFRYAGDRPSRYLAELSRQTIVGVGYCYGDGADAFVTVDCPCGNQGLLHHGCANRLFQGSRLGASGSVPGDVTLTASNLLSGALTMLVSGSTVLNGGAAFGDGIRCISGQTHRLGIRAPTFEMNTVSFRLAPQPPGSVVQYEVFYRDQLPSFCPPALFNLTNAVEIDW